MLILKVAKSFDKHDIPYAIVGGHAVALHGAIRGTLDVDVIIKWNKSMLEKAEQALKDVGLLSRVPVSSSEIFKFRDEYIKNRNMVAWNFINPANPIEQVDLIINTSLKENSTINKRIKGFDVKVLNKKELIKMKKKSGREQDLLDVEALEKL